MTVNALSYTAESTTLESVRLQLENWRSTRVKGNPIPKPLWEAIRGLTEHYPYRRIASAFKDKHLSTACKDGRTISNTFPSIRA